MHVGVEQNIHGRVICVHVRVTCVYTCACLLCTYMCALYCVLHRSKGVLQNRSASFDYVLMQRYCASAVSRAQLYIRPVSTRRNRASNVPMPDKITNNIIFQFNASVVSFTPYKATIFILTNQLYLYAVANFRKLFYALVEIYDRNMDGRSCTSVRPFPVVSLISFRKIE